MPKVIITMPAYHAGGTLAKTVEDIPAGLADQLILVDDASTDNTAQLARDLGIRVFVHPSNQGYGGNQKTCYAMALQEGADVVVLLHPDYQYDPKAVPLLIAPILAGDADMTFGSRFAGLGDPRAGGMPMYRYLGNRLTTVLENLMLGSRFTEMHSGLRAYTRRCLLSLPFLRYTNDFAFDSQLLIDAVTLRQRVVEVPIPTRYTKESSSIAIGASIRYITESLRYCARTTTQRGRRGHRSPVGRPAPVRTLVAASRGKHAGRCALCGSNESSPFRDGIVRCRHCGLVRAERHLGPEELGRAGADVVDDTYLDDEPARRASFEWMVRAMNGYVTRGKRLLEIGPPDGLFLDVARAGGWKGKGIGGDTIDEPARSADVVVAFDVLEHLVDPLGTLRRLRTLVDDEGILALSTSNAADRARLHRGDGDRLDRSRLYYFTPRTLVSLLDRAGFKLVEWSKMPGSMRPSRVFAAARPG